jgi:energy-coupling factor transporter ATP-binding protein EcfA2
MKLVALRARSVRGIPRNWPDLPIGERGMVVYGPNGAGKSSIVDALEFGLTQRSTLYPQNRMNVSWEQGAPHVRDGAPEITLALKDDASRLTVIAPGVSPDAISEEGQAWLSAAAKSSFVLRRHMLLRFINEQPRNRYGLLEPFLNLGEFQEIEVGLKDWLNSLETQQITGTTALRMSEEKLRRIFRLDAGVVPTRDNMFGRLNAILLRLQGKPCNDTLDLKARQQWLATEFGGKDRAGRLADLGGLKAQAQRLGRAGDYQAMLTGLIEALKALEQEIAARSDEILTDFLIRGRNVIRSQSLDDCPLCEQPIDRAAVLVRLDQRIQADARITSMRKLVDQRGKALSDSIGALIAATKQFINDWALVARAALPTAYAQTASMLEEFAAALDSPGLLSAQLKDYPARLAGAVHSHDEQIVFLDELIVAEGGGEQRQLLADAESMIQVLLVDVPKHEALAATATKTERDKRLVTRLHGHAVEARKAAVQAALESVGNTANRFYEIIHPAEQIATSRLAVREAVEQSVNLSTIFYGTEEPPLLHLSESHLDTMGLCYFLAFRKHEALGNPVFRVLILDDVMHSVDSAHRVRIAQLLKQEFADHQMIVTTHDEFFFYAALRRSLGSSGYSYQAISGWDIALGPILGDPSTDLDSVLNQELRRTKNHNDLSASGGRFFEWLLKQIAERLQIAVPARFERKHDIGSLWPAVCSKLKRHAGFPAAHASLPEKLDATVWVRNACGAHDNPAASGVTPGEVSDFLNLLAELYHATFCQNCGTTIGRQGDESWRCNCAQLSYQGRQIAATVRSSD